MKLGYQLKITIQGSKPPIWRRIVVPQNIAFDSLHEVIQIIFGWEFEHLYDFMFREEDVRISLEPDYYEEEDALTAALVDWFYEGRKCRYTYDFGDSWVHEILVEKLVPYEETFAQVIKSKGPNMIEDCGGIWGFYDCIDSAEAFDIEKTNHRLEKLALLGVESRKELANISLKEVLTYYTQDVLEGIVHAHGFTDDIKLYPGTLSEWLYNKMLDVDYLRELFLYMSDDELEFFHDAIEENGISIDEEVVNQFLFISTYGTFNVQELLVIPQEVQEKYQELYTEEIAMKRMRNQNVMHYCRSAIELYGVISLIEFIRIYTIYEMEELTENELMAIIEKYQDEEIVICGEFLLHYELTKDNVYKQILQRQKQVPYYMPEDKGRFLEYGMHECKEPEGELYQFFAYLLYELELYYMQAMEVYYDIQECIQIGPSLDFLAEAFEMALKNYGKEISGTQAKKRARKELKNMQLYTRSILHKGHTLMEIQSMFESENRLILLNEKIYPNNSCPCGSGKKYKKCCGSNKK